MVLPTPMCNRAAFILKVGQVKLPQKNSTRIVGLVTRLRKTAPMARTWECTRLAYVVDEASRFFGAINEASRFINEIAGLL